MIFEIIKKRTEKVDSFSKLLQKAELEYENYLNKKHLNGLNHQRNKKFTWLRKQREVRV